MVVAGCPENMSCSSFEFSGDVGWQNQVYPRGDSCNSQAVRVYRK